MYWKLYHYINFIINLTDDLTEGPNNDKRKDCKTSLKYVSRKDNQVILECLRSKKNYGKDFDKDLIKKFANTYKFCDWNTIKFIFLLRKDINTLIARKNLMKSYFLM